MKYTKKLVALTVALILALALAAPTFATTSTEDAGKGSITVSNPQSGETYTAYKIFDVTYNGTGNYAYFIDSAESQWWTDILLYMGGGGTSSATPDSDGVYTGGGITLTPAESDPTIYYVTEFESTSAAAFAGFLKGQTTGKDGTPLSGGKAENLPLGYYFVSTGTGSLCNLTTTNPAATINDKNEVNFDKDAQIKRGDILLHDVIEVEGSVQIGDTVQYTITGKVPDTSGFETYTYKITDTMTAGLTFDSTSISVKIGSNTYAYSSFTDENQDGIYNSTYFTYDPETSSFTLTFDALEMNEADLAGQEITVTYNAVVNENALGTIVNNKAELEYTNSPDNDTNKVPSEVKLYTAKIVINKYEDGHADKKLANATFILKNEDGKFYTYNESADKVIWVDDSADADPFITNNQGAATIKGLAKGTYYLIETVAPDGYNLLDDEVTVEVNGDAAFNAEPEAIEAALTTTADVANAVGTLLPSTGGIGTTIFYTLGGLLVVGAAVLLVTKKRVHDMEA